MQINPELDVNFNSSSQDVKVENRTLPFYQHEEWMDRVLAIPAESLTLLEDDGNPIGVPANYTVAAKIFKVGREYRAVEFVLQCI